MGKKTIKKDKMMEQEYINSLIYSRYMTELKRVVMSIFEWVNLPDTMNAIKLENDLYMYGSCAILKDPNYGIINTQCTDTRKH